MLQSRKAEHEVSHRDLQKEFSRMHTEIRLEIFKYYCTCVQDSAYQTITHALGSEAQVHRERLPQTIASSQLPKAL